MQMRVRVIIRFRGKLIVRDQVKGKGEVTGVCQHGMKF